MKECNDAQISLPEELSLRVMGANADFEIVPCQSVLDLEDPKRFTKLGLSSALKGQVGALAQQMPSILGTTTVAQAYTVKFPKGLPHTLTELNQGGVSTVIRENGKIVGSASMYAMTTQAAVMGAFMAMSIASGQYFLSQINNEMRLMKMELDKILEFLYGDKKAELMSEMSFVRYAYQNFDSIMSHKEQRVATIASLQEAKKVAMKDVEFYIYDLRTTITISGGIKHFAEIENMAEKMFLIKESLDLAQQLFIMSSIMEVYYSQNFEPAYLAGLEQSLLSYAGKCDNRIRESFSALKGYVSGYKKKPTEKIDKSLYEKRISAVVYSLSDGEDSAVQKTVKSVLHAVEKQQEYYLSGEGALYIKA